MSLASNPKAHYDYEILETLEAGVVLSGQEVKSVRAGKVSMLGSFVKIISNEAVWIGGMISPYQPGNIAADYDNQRTRKLLVRKSELDYLIAKSQEKGLTLIPLKLYDKHGMIKLEIGIARGKKKYDKRESIKKRDVERDIKRKVK